MLALTPKHTCTHLLLLQLTAVCVYVCTSLCRLSATDRFIVAEQQRLVFLSLRESVFSPVEFNQFGGGGRISKPHLPSHVYTEFNFLDTHSHHRAIFCLNRHNTPVKNKHSFTCERV